MSDLFKKISGQEAFEDRKKAKEITKAAQQKIDAYVDQTNTLEADLQVALKQLADMRLSALRGSVNEFLSLLQEFNQTNKDVYQEVLGEIGFSDIYLNDLSIMELRAHDLIAKPLSNVTAVTVACLGVSTLVHGGLEAGALSGLEVGAVQVNALLAYLTGGVGAVLSTAALAATGALALVAGGIWASNHYAKKVSQAAEFKLEVDEACRKMEHSWQAMEAIKKRAVEVTVMLEKIDFESRRELKYFEPIIPDFEIGHIYHLNRFKRMAKWIQTICLITRTPLIDEELNLSQESEEMLVNTQKALDMSVY